ncbi:MAG: hypothetical protein ACR2NP_12825 [Pirellulaceae bacterium]
MSGSKTLLLLLLFAGIICGVTFFVMQVNRQRSDGDVAANKKEEGFLQTRNDFQDKLEELKRKREAAALQIERLDQRKQEAAQRLRDMGVSTAQDIDDDPAARREYDGVRRIMADVDKLNGDLVIYDDAISAIEAELRELNRKKLMENVGIDDDAFSQLKTIINDVDDRLSQPETPQEQLETQRILDDLLGKEDGGDGEQ